MTGVNTMIITGKYTDAIVYGNIIEDEAIAQIQDLCDHPAYEGAEIRIMPDCHSGKGCVIGFTSVSRNKAVIPNVVGVDIGCGILSTAFNTDKPIDYKSIDDYIRSSIPAGMSIRSTVYQSVNENSRFIEEFTEICSIIKEKDNMDHHLKSLGTLGGGNHFIEIDKISDTEYILFIHTGSRNLGKKICNFFQSRSSIIDSEKRCSIIKKHKTAITEAEHASIEREAAELPVVRNDLAYITGEKFNSYIKCMIFAKEFAALNRKIISSQIIDFLVEKYGVSVINSYDTIHNYIDWYDEDHTAIITRKGAVSAETGKRLVIPLNMKDGVIIAEGRGNDEWNCSAPHGAGRLLSRSEAKKIISMDEYIRVMNGVNSWSICEGTVDEAPQAYKPAEEIIKCIGDTVNIIDTAKPVYNFKAS